MHGADLHGADLHGATTPRGRPSSYRLRRRARRRLRCRREDAMPARSCFRLTSLRAAAVAVTLLGSAAVPASAALATAAAPALGPASVAHFNVAQAHSPQLLRQLAAVGGPLRASSGPALRAPFAAAPA